jgi:hypothetical protein
MARGSIVKRKSGNYAIVYYADGKQKWETVGPSRREAERALTARKHEVDTGAWREPSSETLASYSAQWLAHRNPARVQHGRTRLAPSTFAEYRRALLSHVLPRLGERTLASLRPRTWTGLSRSSATGRRRDGLNIVTPYARCSATPCVRKLATIRWRARISRRRRTSPARSPGEHTDAIREARAGPA